MQIVSSLIVYLLYVSFASSTSSFGENMSGIAFYTQVKRPRIEEATPVSDSDNEPSNETFQGSLADSAQPGVFSKTTSSPTKKQKLKTSDTSSTYASGELVVPIKLRYDIGRTNPDTSISHAIRSSTIAKPSPIPTIIVDYCERNRSRSWTGHSSAEKAGVSSEGSQSEIPSIKPTTAESASCPYDYSGFLSHCDPEIEDDDSNLIKYGEHFYLNEEDWMA